MPDPNAHNFGEYAENSDDEDDVECTAEPRQECASGRYCPITLGRVLHNRYEVAHKLGWGGCSTVWLARDLEDNHRVVALKVSTCDAGDDEISIQKRILERVPEPYGLVTSQRDFQLHNDHNKIYCVLFYPLRGPNLCHTIYRVTTAMRMAAARHLLCALKELHDTGFVHRDVSLANIMRRIEPINHWTTGQIYQEFGSPKKVSFTTNTGTKGDLAAPVKIADVLLSPRVRLGDFGLGMGAEDHVDGNYYAGPLAFCAPERYHGHKPSFASDMWSYTVVFARLLVGFEVAWGHDIGQIVALAGRCSSAWRKRLAIPDFEVAHWWYDETIPVPKLRESLESKIARAKGDVPFAIKGKVPRLLQRGLTYNAEERITATEMLQDEDFSAIMSHYACG